MGKVGDRHSASEARPAPVRETVMRGRLRTLAYELTVAESRERSRIARDLHDGLGQLLAVARFKVLELRHSPAEDRSSHLDELNRLLDEATRATRAATFDLSTPVLDLGLDEALRSLVQRLGRHSANTFHMAGQLPAVALPQATLAVLYRVVRELALNAQRHARARQISIRLDGDARQLRITVGDDGIGIATDWTCRALSPEGGFGLLSALAQMQALGGDLALESGAGAGTQATVTLPLDAPPC